jgi:hypothetical protein
VFESSTWRMYDTAPVTSLQSSVTGCAGVAPFAGLRSVGAAGACGVGAVTVSPAVLVTPPKVAVMVTAVEAVTDSVATVKVLPVAPAGTDTLAGTVAAAVLLLESVTTAPPEGAAALRVTVPVEELPPATLVGFSDTAESVGPTGGGFTVIDENWNTLSRAAES